VQWASVTGATEYDLGVRDIATNRFVFSGRVRGTAQRVGVEPGKRYRWNVAACNDAGCSRFSAPLNFTVRGNAPPPPPSSPPPPPPPPPPPVVQAPRVPATPSVRGPGSTGEPGPQQSGTRVTLEWSPVSGAKEYDLGVRDLVTNRLVFDDRVAGTTHRMTLEAGKRYRWNVAACNDAGCSRFSAPLHFTMSSASTGGGGGGGGGSGGGGGGAAAAVPDVPRGATPGRTREPGQQMTIDSVTLQWAEVRGATHYDVQIRDLAARRNTTVGPLRQRFHILKMKKGVSYRWSVRACNATGCSDWNEGLFVTAP
jgi:hypothetical protein